MKFDNIASSIYIDSELLHEELIKREVDWGALRSACNDIISHCQSMEELCVEMLDKSGR